MHTCNNNNNNNNSAIGATKRSIFPTMDDPRQLAQYDEDKRRQIILQLRRNTKSDPVVMVSKPAAITCRVASSSHALATLSTCLPAGLAIAV